jgi:hypothetical protein
VRTLKTVLIFLISGLGSGSSIGWLLSSKRLTSFWFRKSDKFLVPTYRYYAGFSILLLSGLAGAYLVSRNRGWIEGPLTKSTFRHTASALVIALSAPAIFAIFNLDRDFFESPGWVLVAVLAFLFLISIACWILTGRLYYPGVLINLSTIPLAISLLLLLGRIMNISGEQSEIVTFPIYHSLIAAGCGYWIARNNPAQIQTDE